MSTSRRGGNQRGGVGRLCLVDKVGRERTDGTAFDARVSLRREPFDASLRHFGAGTCSISSLIHGKCGKTERSAL
jgi:hypothetical protein